MAAQIIDGKAVAQRCRDGDGAALLQGIGEAGDVDTAAVQMQTASGKIAVITNSRRASYGYDQRIEVHGSAGMVAAENQRPVSIEVANAKGYTRPPLHDFFMTRYTEAYAAEITAFIEAVGTKKVAAPSGEDGLAALALAEADELDLVMIAENADPPVCKIIDYKKFLYDQK